MIVFIPDDVWNEYLAAQKHCRETPKKPHHVSHFETSMEHVNAIARLGRAKTRLLGEMKSMPETAFVLDVDDEELPPLPTQF
jgi:hypothetical protein